SEVGQYTQVSITNCDPNAAKCILVRGTTVTITIDFTINEPVNTVTAVVLREQSGTITPIPIPNPNACTDPNSGISCPLSGDTFRYKYTLSISYLYPKMAGNVLWKLQDEDKKNIVCVKIPAEIQ
ncbi:hypothetical protein PV326_006720, partial [Microctonus aethiopoides]